MQTKCRGAFLRDFQNLRTNLLKGSKFRCKNFKAVVFYLNGNGLVFRGNLSSTSTDQNWSVDGSGAVGKVTFMWIILDTCSIFHFPYIFLFSCISSLTWAPTTRIPFSRCHRFWLMLHVLMTGAGCIHATASRGNKD